MVILLLLGIITLFFLVATTVYMVGSILNSVFNFTIGEASSTVTEVVTSTTGTVVTSTTVTQSSDSSPMIMILLIIYIVYAYICLWYWHRKQNKKNKKLSILDRIVHAICMPAYTPIYAVKYFVKYVIKGERNIISRKILQTASVPDGSVDAWRMGYVKKDIFDSASDFLNRASESLGQTSESMEAKSQSSKIYGEYRLEKIGSGTSGVIVYLRENDYREIEVYDNASFAGGAQYKFSKSSILADYGRYFNTDDGYTYTKVL